MEFCWGESSSRGEGLGWPLFFSFLPQARFSLVSSAGKLQHNSEVFLKPEEMEHFVKFKSVFLETFSSIF